MNESFHNSISLYVPDYRRDVWIICDYDEKPETGLHSTFKTLDRTKEFTESCEEVEFNNISLSPHRPSIKKLSPDKLDIHKLVIKSIQAPKTSWAVFVSGPRGDLIWSSNESIAE